MKDKPNLSFWIVRPIVGSGVLLAIESLAVWNIKETFGSREPQS